MKRTHIQSVFALLVASLFLISGCVRPSDDPVIEIPTTGSEQPITIEEYPATEENVDTQQVTDGETGNDGATDATTPDENTAVEEAVETENSTENVTENEATNEEAAETTTETTETVVETAPADGIYTVQSGDTLGKIAERFGVSVNDIAAASGLTNIHTLDVGQELTIPEAGFAETTQANTEETSERVHVVRSGDTLYSIGLSYGFTVQELQQHNGIANVNSLDIGQEIKIPASE